MRVYLDCYACFMRQALQAARLATNDETIHQQVLDKVSLMLPGAASRGTPVTMGQKVHRLVREITAFPDPYRQIKERSNELALSLYPQMRQWLEKAEDRLEAAIKMAAGGNVVDYGPEHHIDLRQSLLAALEKPIEAASYHSFRNRLGLVDTVLIIGDNAGEIACDRLLVEQLQERGKRVIYAVRGSPVLNDATLADARQVGLDKCAGIVTTGSDAPGVYLDDTSDTFRNMFRGAPLIIAKGQGNYEGLSGQPGPIFYLLIVKCPVLARDVDARVGSIVLKQ